MKLSIFAGGSLYKSADKFIRVYGHLCSTSQLGANSQNFIKQICKIFVTLRWFYIAIIHRKYEIYYYFYTS